ncbi:hypothetical protein SPRG_02996 [Saprolegnia parasitica CBS 223.65]|uniref:F-box domain-containing protein n=1 Tax=Saprolegnia parasitica (strain CBS 223.65) TaxID=695850 RepID=A0A067CP88_SAPPC|nr:hypothetical protein SPRG_02996 [Saprolegnia parasitica CBS 223.65]KDO32519.1 hypothetical protein SPRG_02996 [Saprolegnia parasitica CBS 223.65]|eukprot:XP_012196968.1 hypothetical protein SPRG_02996 [Saprolegnia parasitica CBS 223.65]
MEAKRALLDATDVLFTIVQYTPSPTDVASLLRALPPATLTPPLAALLELITPDKPWETNPFWPQPRIRRFSEADIDRFVTAMPLFNSVCIDDYSFSKHWPTYGAIDSDDVDDLHFFHFVVRWAAKMTHMTLAALLKYGASRKTFLNMLRMCTSLHTVQLPYAVDVLEAVTTPAHCVQDLELKHLYYSPEYTLGAAPIIECWLASGHARRLGLVDFWTGDAGLGKELALAASTLSNLCLTDSPAILQTVISNGIAWTHLTELDLDLGNKPTGNVLRKLVPLLNVSQLQNLTLRNVQAGNSVCFLSLLPSLAALTDLRLHCVDIGHARPMLASPLLLRSADFHDVKWTKRSFAAVLKWALRSPTLESITWSGADVYMRADTDAVQDAIRRCLDAGVRRVVYREGFMASSEMLAGAVRDIHAPRPCTVVCCIKLKTTKDIRSLFSALATCTNVTLDVNVYPYCAPLQEFIGELAQEAGIVVDYKGGPLAHSHYWTARSPSPL